MNRRSFFSALAGLPFLPSIAKAALNEPKRQSYTKGQADIKPILRDVFDIKDEQFNAVMKDVEFQRALQAAKENGTDPPSRSVWLYKDEEIQRHAWLWANAMTGLKSCVDPKARCLGVTTGTMTWWFPLTRVKRPELENVHAWWKTLPEA